MIAELVTIGVVLSAGLLFLFRYAPKVSYGTVAACGFVMLSAAGLVPLSARSTQVVGSTASGVGNFIGGSTTTVTARAEVAEFGDLGVPGA